MIRVKDINMKKSPNIINNEKGSLMVIAIVILALLTIVGLSITTTTSIELQIAGNDKLYKRAFYTADGGTEVGSELLEQNLGCVGIGFTETDIGDSSDTAIRVLNASFGDNTSATEPSENDPDFFFPVTFATDSTIPHTNVTVGGNTALSTGTAIQMAAGYEGKGKGAGAGGAYILYDMYSQHLGQSNSESIIGIQWRHIIGTEGACNY